MNGQKGSIPVPVWVLITFVLSVLVGGAGWIQSGLQAKQDANTIEDTQKIRQLENEDRRQNDIAIANTYAISDLKTAVAVGVENAKRLDRIEDLVNQILQRVR